ncbi:MAG: hypothetical protein ABEI52_11130 [Halobacteriaceae archaeon]
MTDVINVPPDLRLVLGGRVYSSESKYVVRVGKSAGSEPSVSDAHAEISWDGTSWSVRKFAGVCVVDGYELYSWGACE